MPFDLAPETLAYAALVFILAGMVKGVIGIGLPLVCVPLLSETVGPVTAMALMAVPIVGVNAWQMVQSGYLGWAVRRFWTALPAMIVGVLLGVVSLTRLASEALTVLVGCLVILVSVSQLFPMNIDVPERRERWMTPGIGFASGIVGGLSSFLGPLMAIYLVALRLSKDQFVGTIAMFYFIAAAPFFGGLAVSGHLGGDELLGSAAGTALILVGVVAGQAIRKRASQEAFRRAVLIMLILIGANMIRKGLS